MSSSNVDVKLQRITSVPRSAGLYLSIAAMLVGATAISIASAALYKLKYEQQKVTANEKLWLGMEEALRKNQTHTEQIKDTMTVRQGLVPSALCSISANTQHQLKQFLKDTAIGPLAMVQARGLICPNPKHPDKSVCPTDVVPSDQSGIRIRQTGWYYVYGVVSFGSITERTKLGWRIVSCRVLEDKTKSQCNMMAKNNFMFEAIAEREAAPGNPGTLYGGRIMFCWAGDVLSIMPLYDNLQINMFDKTELGAFMIVPN